MHKDKEILLVYVQNSVFPISWELFDTTDWILVAWCPWRWSSYSTRSTVLSSVYHSPLMPLPECVRLQWVLGFSELKEIFRTIFLKIAVSTGLTLPIRTWLWHQRTVQSTLIQRILHHVCSQTACSWILTHLPTMWPWANDLTSPSLENAKKAPSPQLLWGLRFCKGVTLLLTFR
jgi:hypothetical protein